MNGGKGGSLIFVFALPLWSVAYVAGVLCSSFFIVRAPLAICLIIVSSLLAAFVRTWFAILIFGLCCGYARCLLGDLVHIPEQTIFTHIRALCDLHLSAYIEQPYRTLVSGVLFGGGSGFSSEWKQVFRSTGTMHIIAVSGANVSFVVRWLEWMLHKMRAAPRTKFYIVVCAICSYVLATGAPASVVRAALMALVVHVAPLIGRRVYQLHALAAAAACMVMLNPSIAKDIGFQFSCLATLGLIIFERPNAPLTGVIAETIAATMFVLPLEIYYFKLMSVGALIANIIAAPFVPLLMIGGIGVLITTLIASYATVPLAYCIELLARAMMNALTFIAHIPGSSANIQINIFAVVVWYLALGWYIWRRLRLQCYNGTTMKAALLIFLLLIVGAPLHAHAAVDTTTSTAEIISQPQSTLDSDGDGFTDEEELFAGYDPHSAEPIKLPKTIKVSIKDQRLRYYTGDYLVKEIKVSTGIASKPTPRGTFTVDLKLPSHLYAGPGYYFPNTKWNMRFKFNKNGSYYIHGAYWHNSFGKPRSHGCVNVAYKDVETLYNWAPVGTPVTIE